MPNLYIASDKAYEKIKSLAQGFWLEIDDKGTPVLLLKLEPSLIDSIIKGTKIELVIRNPNLRNRSCTLYIYDIPNNPFYVSWQELSEEDKNYKGFDAVCIKCANADRIALALYNELSHPIFTTYLNVNSDPELFSNWLFNVYNNYEYKLIPAPIEEGYFFPENVIKGYSVQILNVDNSEVEKVSIFAASNYVEVENGSESDYTEFNIDNYQANGKHGYHQELAVKNRLINLFKQDVDIFASPRSHDDTEFTDFIILFENFAIIIESKYIASEKATLRHKAITKAIDQLNRVQKAILQRSFNLESSELSDKLQNVNNVIKMCLLNDRIILTENNTKKITQLYRKEELPIFISVSSLYQLLVSIKLMNEEHFLSNFILNLQLNYTTYLNSTNTILYIREFKIHEIKSED